MDAGSTGVAVPAPELVALNVPYNVVDQVNRGHASGDVASKIVMTEVFSELKLRSGDTSILDREICGLLRQAAFGANDCLRAYVEEYPESAGMGATLEGQVQVLGKQVQGELKNAVGTSQDMIQTTGNTVKGLFGNPKKKNPK